MGYGVQDRLRRAVLWFMRWPGPMLMGLIHGKGNLERLDQIREYKLRTLMPIGVPLASMPCLLFLK